MSEVKPNIQAPCNLRFNSSKNPNGRIVEAVKNRLDEIVIQRSQLDVEEDTLKSFLSLIKPCPKCDGSGIFEKKTCPQCAGKGMLG